MVDGIYKKGFLQNIIEPGVSSMKIRSPILVALGHVDHGKTSLLDRIRGSSIAMTEPGLITQYISASYIPNNVIRERAGKMLSRLGIELTIPGILWIDSPGHEAFTTLRKRGGAIADFAVLVVDINEGFQPQTLESINFLKQYRTPFAVALTKIDRIVSWNPQEGQSFLVSIEEQPSRTKEEFEEKFYRVVGELGKEGFSAERFDRVEDYSKQVAIVPLSSATGEGIPDLLVVVAGIAQKFLRKGLEIQKGEGKGTVLEVKEFRGLGTTIDVIVYDGEIRRGDFLVVGGKEAVRSRVKALLKPAPLKEMRIEKEFRPVEHAVAAAAVKIAGPDLAGVMPGSPLRAVRDKKDVEKAAEEVKEETEEVEFESDREGVILRADTLGSLEALLKTLKGIVPVKKALVGSVSRADVMEMKVARLPVIFAFGIRVSPEIEKLAKDSKVNIFASDVIYRMVESYQEWEKQSREREMEALLEKAVRPAVIRVLPGFLFRQKKPAVFGVEILKGTLKAGATLLNKGKPVGEVKEIQDKGNSLQEAVQGEKVALSMPDVVYGKHVREGDELSVQLKEKDLEILKKVMPRLRNDERELLEGVDR
jgi:translation initiation factor 5B